MIKRVIFGGSFDPVHDGHVRAVELLLRVYDRVIIIPAATSPFKTGCDAPCEARLAMLRLAFAGSRERVEICEEEIVRGGSSYTYQTMARYPDCALAVGGDSMNTLATWARADLLKKFEIAVIERAGTDCAKASEAWLLSGGRIRKVGSAPDISSTAIRLKVSLGLPAEVPQSVRDYIDAHGLYREWAAIIDRFPEFRLSETRIRHIARVALTALELAVRYGVNQRDAVQAALLHDIAKYYTAEDAAGRGVTVSREALEAPRSVRHAHLGADIARDLFGASPGVTDAVRYHTTGRAGMSTLEEIVALADYMEPGREHPQLEPIRAFSRTSLPHAMRAMYRTLVAHLKTKGAEVDGNTIKALEYYENLS